MRRTSLLSFFAVMVISGTSCDERRVVSGGKTQVASSVKPAAVRPSPAKPPLEKVAKKAEKPCEEVSKRLRELLKGGGACKKKSDCRCYPGGVVDCGGVTDASTAGKVMTLMRLFRLAHCGLKFHCAPRLCFPGCVAGRCVRSARVEAEGTSHTIAWNDPGRR